jgi:hypothetical protein
MDDDLDAEFPCDAAPSARSLDWIRTASTSRLSRLRIDTAVVSTAHNWAVSTGFGEPARF